MKQQEFITELHLKQLLTRCEEKVASFQMESCDETLDHERLQHKSKMSPFQRNPLAQMRMINFVEKLDEYLDELRKNSSKSREYLEDYDRRIEKLKLLSDQAGLVMSSPAMRFKKALLTKKPEELSEQTFQSNSKSESPENFSQALKEIPRDSLETDLVERTPPMTHHQDDPSSSIQSTMNSLVSDTRDESSLPSSNADFSTDAAVREIPKSGELRFRKTTTSSFHDTYADKMIELAQTLKSNSLTMSQILATDEKVLSDSHRLLASNQVQLTKHTDKVIKIKQGVLRNTLWMWFVMFFLMFTTLLTYFFIRLFPKR